MTFPRSGRGFDSRRSHHKLRGPVGAKVYWSHVVCAVYPIAFNVIRQAYRRKKGGEQDRQHGYGVAATRRGDAAYYHLAIFCQVLFAQPVACFLLGITDNLCGITSGLSILLLPGNCYRRYQLRRSTYDIVFGWKLNWRIHHSWTDTFFIGPSRGNSYLDRRLGCDSSQAAP